MWYFHKNIPPSEEGWFYSHIPITPSPPPVNECSVSFKEAALSNLRYYVKSSNYNRNLWANHRLYRQQNDSIVPTGASVKLIYTSCFLVRSFRIRGEVVLEKSCVIRHLQPCLSESRTSGRRVSSVFDLFVF